MGRPDSNFFLGLSKLPALRALHYRDFRWLWFGAFLSFTGSQVQNVAQQDLVLDMTHSPAKLAMVSFAMMAPISLLGPVLGVAADMYDKRRLLVVCMCLCAVGPIGMAFAGFGGFLAYWMFIVSSVVAGLVSCVEVPTRQSIVRSVVDEKDLAAAIPMQASTFNLARVIGPAIGGIVAFRLGAAMCFLLNGLSFFALAIASLAIRADLKPVQQRVEPIKDLVLEGFRYTFRHKGLRTLFLMEAATAVFGTFYSTQMSAIAASVFGSGSKGATAACFTAVGIGAILGLGTAASLSSRPIKPHLVRWSMTGMALSVTFLGYAHVAWLVYLLLALMGAFSIIQFNTTNTLFQLIAPESLRGRVVSMHMWAIGGIAPLGVFVFGHVSEWFGIPVAMWSGGLCLAGFAIWGWTQSRHVVEPRFGL